MKTYAPVPQGCVPTFRNTKAIFIIDDLADLAGPTSGIVTLPLYLDWSRLPTYDITRPNRLRSLYATVLQEAGSELDLATYIDAGLLKREWSALNLPMDVREAWEDRHPALRS